jgi:hypothetical protein
MRARGPRLTTRRLALTDDAVPISSADASVLIAAVAASLEFVPAVGTVDGIPTRRQRS